MATLGRTSPSPPHSRQRRRKSWPRKIEHCCCQTITYFPLTFVYGLTTWAAWVEVHLGFMPDAGWWNGRSTSLLGMALYLILNTSYTIAVFTDPGSPTTGPVPSKTGGRGGSGGSYSSLPTHDTEASTSSTVAFTSLTAKSSGRPRYCKKCQCAKPDRAHHCSTCNRCVLKMDHHCPWLATCVGLRNYKPFLLFLTYTSLFCWLCFATSMKWVWTNILNETQLQEGVMLVNIILLAILGGIIGLVLSGFTAWHIYLLTKGQTTIESLEKTRYLSPVKKSMEQQYQRERQDAINNHNHYSRDSESGLQQHQQQGFVDQLKEIHANALPGVTRPEEGEDRNSNSSSTSPSPSPTPSFPSHAPSAAQESLRDNYARTEHQRERDRYQAYLDEQDSEKLPHAFDLGWRRNLSHVLGPNKWLWLVPVCNTSGDGWNWEVSQRWILARDEAARERSARQRAQQQRWTNGTESGYGMPAHGSASAYGSGPPRGPPGMGAGRHYQSAPAPGHVPPPSLLQQQQQQQRQQNQHQSHRRNSRSPRQNTLQMQTFENGHKIDDDDDDDDDGDEYDTSSEEEDAGEERRAASSSSLSGSRETGAGVRPTSSSNWNDVPEDFLSAGRASGPRSRSRGRRKGD